MQEQEEEVLEDDKEQEVQGQEEEVCEGKTKRCGQCKVSKEHVDKPV